MTDAEATKHAYEIFMLLYFPGAAVWCAICRPDFLPQLAVMGVLCALLVSCL